MGGARRSISRSHLNRAQLFRRVHLINNRIWHQPALMRHPNTLSIQERLQLTGKYLPNVCDNILFNLNT